MVGRNLWTIYHFTDDRKGDDDHQPSLDPVVHN